MCVDIPKAAAIDGDGRDNAANVGGGPPHAVGGDDTIAGQRSSIIATSANHAPL